MPVAFHEAEDLDELGSAGFVRLERAGEGDCALGALFVVNARGEPLEFAYNRVRVPHRFLWRQADLRRYTERRLVASLLSVCTHQPRLLLCLADEVGPALFARDIRLSVPVGRIGPPLGTGRRVDPHTGEILEDEPPLHVSWQPEPPAEGSAERQLFEHLAASGLLDEPFERALVGLREVYEAGAR